MTGQQPADWHSRATIRNDAAPHQIRLSQASNGGVYVSCTCQWHNHQHVPLGWFPTTAGPEPMLHTYREHLRGL